MKNSALLGALPTLALVCGYLAHLAGVLPTFC